MSVYTFRVYIFDSTTPTLLLYTLSNPFELARSISWKQNSKVFSSSRLETYSLWTWTHTYIFRIVNDHTHYARSIRFSLSLFLFSIDTSSSKWRKKHLKRKLNSNMLSIYARHEMCWKLAWKCCSRSEWEWMKIGGEPLNALSAFFANSHLNSIKIKNHFAPFIALRLSLQIISFLCWFYRTISSKRKRFSSPLTSTLRILFHFLRNRKDYEPNDW